VELVELIRAEQYDRLASERLLILQGSVASTVVEDRTVETYRARVELVASRWVGLEDIEVYRVIVILDGSEFSNRVVERLPRDPGPEIILTNSELLVVAKFIGTWEPGDGSIIPVVTAIAVR